MIRLGSFLAVLVLIAGCGDGGDSGFSPTVKESQLRPRLTAEMATKEYALRLQQTLIVLNLIKDKSSAKKRKDYLEFAAFRCAQLHDSLKGLKPETAQDHETIARLTPEIQSLEKQVRDAVARVQRNAEAAAIVAAALKSIANLQ